MPKKTAADKKQEHLTGLRFKGRSLEQRGLAWQQKVMRFLQDDPLNLGRLDLRDPFIAKMASLFTEGAGLIDENREFIEEYQKPEK